MSEKLLRAMTKELPIHRGNGRLWVEAKAIYDTDMGQTLTYHYMKDEKSKRLTILTNDTDDRTITVRKTKMVPIIDINNSDITALYKGIDKVTIKIYTNKIVIEPLKELKKQMKAKGKLGSREITFVELFSGGGLLSKALTDAGMKSIGAVELDQRYLSNYEANNPNTLTYLTSVAEMEYSILPSSATVLAVGLPCECWTSCGIAKQKSIGKKSREAGETGSLGYFFLRTVEQLRPALILLEETVGIQNSAMLDIIKNVLVMFGYKISEKILYAPDYGDMTKRRRYALVATIKETPFEFSDQMQMNLNTVENILEELPLEERVWLDRDNSPTIKYSLEKEQKHIQKGEGFRIARTYLKDTLTATVTKYYYKIQLTNPILCHPEKEDTFSLFTPRELARLQGMPEDFILPEHKTVAGEILGQGVSYASFYQLGRDILKHLKGA